MSWAEKITPIWNYGFRYGGSASNSNIEILQRSEPKSLQSILNAPWYINKQGIH
jgi:hypothetical protein